MARQATVILVVDGKDMMTPVSESIAKGMEKVEAKAKQAGQALDNVGAHSTKGTQQATAEVDKLASRFSRFAAGQGGFSNLFGVAFSEESASALGATNLLAMGVTGLGIAAGKTAWDLGAMALKTDAVAKYGKDAKTSVDDLGAAIEHAKLAAGRQVAPMIDQFARGAAGIIEGLAGNEKESLQHRRKALEAEIARVEEAGGKIGGRWGYITTGQLQAQLDEVNVKLGDQAKAAYADSWAIEEVTNRAAAFKAAMGDMGMWSDVGTAGMMRQADMLNGVTWNSAAVDLQSREGRGISELQRITDENNAESNVRDYQDKVAKAKDYARVAATAYENEMSQRISRLSGMLDAGKSMLTGLWSGEDPLTGPNGPFKALREISDIAAHGAEGKYGKDTKMFMERYGLDQAGAQGIMGDVQRGLWSPRVMQYMDMGAMVNEANLQEAAESSREAFAKALEAAGAGGRGSEIMMSMLGLGKSKDGKTAAPDMAPVVDTYLTAITTKLQTPDAFKPAGKAFADNFFGATITSLEAQPWVQAIVGLLLSQLNAQFEGKNGKPPTK